MDKDSEENFILRYARQALTLGKLDLNVDHPGNFCRDSFKQVYFRIRDQARVNVVRDLRLPTDDWKNEENEVLDLVSGFEKLNICILNGSKRTRGGLNQLPNAFQSLHHLTHLDLSFNSFETLPAPLQNLENLRLLVLNYNHLTRLVINDSFPPLVRELHCRCNRIKVIEFCSSLSHLEVLELSSNLVEQLVFDVENSVLKRLQVLNLKDNKLTDLPQITMVNNSFPNLERFTLSHNFIEFLPDRIELLPSLKCLDLSFNIILSIPEFYHNSTVFSIKGNPTLTTSGHERNASPTKKTDDYEVEKLTMMSDIASFDVNTKGLCVEFPSGVVVTFPRDCLTISSPQHLFCRPVAAEETHLILNPLDQLLSGVIELGPTGSRFSKGVQITIPFNFTAFDEQQREIVMRSLTRSHHHQQSIYQDLQAEVVKCDKSGEYRATSHTLHFTTFAVVSRLVQDSVHLQQDTSSVLWCSCNPITKISFPRQSVVCNTKVELQTLRVSPSYLQRLGRSDVIASDVIHVRCHPPDTTFRQPVTVFLSLPDQLVGKSFDHEKLRLLKWTSKCDDVWDDVTEQHHLHFTTINVSFTTNNFCRYWLVWENIKGVVRQVYRRLTTYNVQFLVMQRTSIPTALIAQCVREEMIESRLKQLVDDEGYYGNHPYTNVHQLMEGEMFKIQVNGGIQLKAHDERDRKHLQGKVLIKRFHSQHPPHKTGFTRFFIEPSCQQLQSSSDQPSSGYVSFYKLTKEQVPCNKQQPLAMGDAVNQQQQKPSKRQHDCDERGDRQHEKQEEKSTTTISKQLYLDDVLIVLEPTEKPLPAVPEFDVPLNFGELGTGMFSDINLRHIAAYLGSDWMELGHFLGLKTAELDRIQMDYRSSAKEQIFRMLRYWSYLNMHKEDCVEIFVQALIDCDRKDIADKVDQIYRDGKKRYEQSVKRIRTDIS